ncbi:MAG: glucosamine-6-phosphate deaminase [Eubacteriales bacterium]|nr:glucosamine-6-phosphate deaminase [Eubacteriales bacterium]
MVLHRAKDYNDMSRKAANVISAKVIIKPDSVLGLATGSSPEGTYKQLIEWHKKGDIDFSKTKAVNLDEYKGLSKEDEQSYAWFMRKNLFDHINIDLENTYIPNGLEEDTEKESKRYDDVIKSLGGVDLQLLGIGVNGHIGFNEPNDFFQKGTHCVKLTEETINTNSRFFESMDLVPKYAYSMGIQSIMSAKSILLIASGKSKANALYETIYGNIRPSVPGTILQLHPDVTIIADEDALSLIKEKGLLK